MKRGELVFLPAAPLSHLLAAVETAKLLLSRAEGRLSVTLVTMNPSKDVTVDNYITRISSSSNTLLRFIHLPAPEGPPNPSKIFQFEYTQSRAPHVRQIISNLVKQSPPSSQVAGLVLDIFTTNFIDVAEEFNLPSYVLSTCGACHLGMSRGLVVHIAAMKASGADFNPPTTAEYELSVPYFSLPVPSKVLPGTKFPENPINYFEGRCLTRLSEAKGIVVNTFYEFESHAIDALMSDTKAPKVYPVGPVLKSSTIGGGAGAGDEDDDVKKWLDGQPEKSVVFLCFGSMGSLVDAQVREIAVALENSGSRFLWSMRDGGALLPEGFLERTKGAGKIIGWAPQEAVLAHKAVGGFVSHCGWNSILESVWFGVPIAALPMFAEQHLNAFELVEELRMAEAITLDYHMDLTGKTPPEIVGAEEVEAAIRRVMAAEGGNGVRVKVEEMQKKAKAALEEGGSSYKAQTSFVEDVFTNIS